MFRQKKMFVMSDLKKKKQVPSNRDVWLFLDVCLSL